MTLLYRTRRTEAHLGRCEDVLCDLTAARGAFASLAWVDGPYGMGKGEWDRLSGARHNRTAIPDEAIEARVSRYVDLLADLDPDGADLAAWYAPVLYRISAACLQSASAYVWNTDAGEAVLRPVMQALGWTYRGRIVWQKPSIPASRSDLDVLRTWLDVTEACGFYQREAWALSGGAGSTIAAAANGDERNPMVSFFVAEREAAGMTRRDLSRWFPSASGGLTGCVSNWEGGQNFPTWEVWRRCAEAMTTEGPKRDRPYLVLPEVWGRAQDPLRASYDHLRAEYDHLRAEYEASRPAFACPVGVSNVWQHPQVSGAERLKLDGEAHPCQKPLAFAKRAILASSRPGEVVLDPFAGTCRCAVAVERLPASEAREVVSIDIDRAWLDAVRPSLAPLPEDTGTADQPSLFGAAAPRVVKA